MNKQTLEDIETVRNASEGEKVTVMSSTLCELHLRCDVCHEWRELLVDQNLGGHSWQAANAIADEFDRYHDEECGS